MPRLLSATQAIFCRSAHSRPCFISALPSAQRGTDRGLHRGLEQAPSGKKKIISYRWEQVCFNSEMFPSRAKLSFNSLAQNVPLVVSTLKEGNDLTQQSSSGFPVLQHMSFRFNSRGRGTKPSQFVQLPKNAQNGTFSDIQNSNLLLTQSSEQTLTYFRIISSFQASEKQERQPPHILVVLKFLAVLKFWLFLNLHAAHKVEMDIDINSRSVVLKTMNR